MSKISKGGAKPSKINLDSVQASHGETIGLLKTIDKDLEDIRSIITCRVCVKPLYEPFTIECGHTFCYSCLVSWFEKNRANKSCPDCRAKVKRKPAPAYLVREITQLFSNRAELLPAGETTQYHKDQQGEERRHLESDKGDRGLFRGWFRHEEHFDGSSSNRIIIDEEDGVSRCPMCAWELEDGECEGCGWPATGSEIEAAYYYDDMAAYDSMNPSEPDSHDEEDDDDSDDEDESDGSLQGFVVSDQQIRELPQSIHSSSSQQARNLSQNRVSHARGSLPASLSDASFDDGPFSGYTSDGNTDAVSYDVGGSSVDTDTLERQNHPALLEDPWRPARASGSEDDEVIIARYERRLEREREREMASQAGDPVSRARQSSGRPIDQNPLHPSRVRPVPRDRVLLRTQRDRNARHFVGNSNHRSTNVIEISTSDEEDLNRAIDDLPPRLFPSASQRPRRRPTRPIIIDEDDEEDMFSVARPTRISNQRIDDSLHGLPQPGASQQQTRAVPVGPTSNGRASNQNNDGGTLQPRLDPGTSIPVRRENVNMPGAFPPSFVSEQGQSQSTPPMNAGAFSSPMLHDRSLATRPMQPPEEDQHGFLDRRRHEERSTQATHMQQTRRRDRSAAKAARRQDRERVKAEQDARGSRGGEPSAPPLLTM